MTHTPTDEPRVHRLLPAAKRLSGVVLAVVGLVLSRDGLGFLGAGGTLTAVAVVPLEIARLGRISRGEQFSVAAGETHRWSHEAAPTLEGTGLRLTYLLYEGTAPDDPATDSVSEHCLWVNVTD